MVMILLMVVMTMVMIVFGDEGDDDFFKFYGVDDDNDGFGDGGDDDFFLSILWC